MLQGCTQQFKVQGSERAYTVVHNTRWCKMVHSSARYKVVQLRSTPCLVGGVSFCVENTTGDTKAKMETQGQLCNTTEKCAQQGLEEQPWLWLSIHCNYLVHSIVPPPQRNENSSPMTSSGPPPPPPPPPSQPTITLKYISKLRSIPPATPHPVTLWLVFMSLLFPLQAWSGKLGEMDTGTSIWEYYQRLLE